MIEERFKFYSKSNTTTSNGTILLYELYDFLVGGTYNSATYQYTVANGGTYLVGFSVSGALYSIGVCQMRRVRNSVNTTSFIVRFDGSENSTRSSCGVITLEAGDILYPLQVLGPVKMNRFQYDTDDIYNSFWGIRIYD